MEEAAKSFGPMMKLMYGTIGALGNAFYEKYGKDALAIITKVAAKSGVEYAKIIQKTMPVRNLKDIGEMFKMTEAMLGSQMETIEMSDNVLHFKSSQCPLGIQGTSKELCEAMMTSDRKMANTLLGQEVKAKILKTRAAGDKYCEVIFSTK